MIMYLQLIIGINQMKSQEYIGISKNCKGKCQAHKKQAYSQRPHNGDHEILSSKQFVRKLTNSNITTVDSIMSENVQLINNLVEQTIEFVKNFGNEAILGLRKQMLRNMLDQKKQITQKLQNSFTKLTKLEYQQLSCQQLNEVFSSIKKNCKSSALQKTAQEYIKKVQKKFKLITSSQLDMKQKIGGSKISNQSSVQSIPDIQDQDMESVGNFFASEQTSQGDISIDFSPNDKSQSFDNTLINQLDQLNISEGGFKKKQKLPDQSFFTQKKSENKEKKSHIKNFDSDHSQQQLKDVTQLIQKPKKQIFVKKNEKKQQEKVQKIDYCGQKQEIDPKKSYVNKQQGRYYIKVCHLKKQTQKTEKSRFNIQLKVVQKVMYRLFYDKNSQKTYKKVKFIAGDENGLVVCYTNHIKQLKKDSYVVLKDCILDQFKQRSYQISSNKCQIIRQKRSFNVKFQNSISRFSSMNPLIYSIQKQQSTWPSVLGIAYLDRKKCKKIQLIVQIDQIIDEQGDKIQCYLSDGTAQIFARIDRNALPQELVDQKSLIGSVFFMKKLSAHEQKQGLQDFIYLKVGKQNSPTLIKDMEYNDNIPIKNVNQIYKELKEE